MTMTRPHKLLILCLLAVYVPLVGSLDLWHHHDAPDSDGEHSCAACHFAAAHGPVVQPEPMQLDGAVQSEGSEPRAFSYLISIAAVSRGPPAVSG